MKNTIDTHLSGGVRAARMAFAVLSAAFALCITAQVFLAGMSIFVDPSHWAHHSSFVHWIGFVPLLMLAVGFAGKVPARLRWYSAALFALIYAMYATANIGGIQPWIAAAHPVLAMIIFWLSIRVASQARRMTSESGRGAA